MWLLPVWGTHKATKDICNRRWGEQTFLFPLRKHLEEKWLGNTASGCLRVSATAILLSKVALLFSFLSASSFPPTGQKRNLIATYWKLFWCQLLHFPLGGALLREAKPGGGSWSHGIGKGGELTPILGESKHFLSKSGVTLHLVFLKIVLTTLTLYSTS